MRVRFGFDAGNRNPVSAGVRIRLARLANGEPPVEFQGAAMQPSIRHGLDRYFRGIRTDHQQR
jgi:hypothetical protein